MSNLPAMPSSREHLLQPAEHPFVNSHAAPAVLTAPTHGAAPRSACAGHAALSTAFPRQAPRAPFDFTRVNALALSVLPSLLARWLPEGRLEGREYVARNPRRADRHLGSFKVNLRTGRWADFATGDRGGDPVSLAAYLFGLPQIEAGHRLAHTVGLPSGRAHHG